MAKQVIQEIKILGATKTTHKAILKKADIHLGDDLSDEEFLDLKRRVGLSDQFILKRMDFADGIVTIEIREKWTMIPLPIITQSGSYYNRGFVIYENNFLGRMEKLVPALSWNNSGFNWVLLYTSESLFNQNFGFSTIMINMTDRSNVKKKKGKNIVEFDSKMKAIELTPSFSMKSHMFKVGPFFFEKQVMDLNKQPFFSYRGIGFHARYQFSQHESLKMHKKGFYNIFNFHYVPNYKSQTFYRFENEFHHTIPMGNHFLDFFNRIGYLNFNDFLFPYFLGSEEGHRGYNSLSLPVSQFAAQSIQFQYNINKRFFFVPFYEVGYYRYVNFIPLRKYNLDHTLGAGFRYYIKKLSLPGINLEYAYNLSDYSHHIHFSLGIKL